MNQMPPIIKTSGIYGYNELREKIDLSKTEVKSENCGCIYTYKDKNNNVIMTRSVGEYGSSRSFYTYKGNNGKEIRLWDLNSNGYVEMMRVQGDDFYYGNSADDKDFDVKVYDNGKSKLINWKGLSPTVLKDMFCGLWNDYVAPIFK